jgi:antitoxin (DNA-binding transcriptional repressor) of toxin-antitoxin stability system
VETIRIRDLRGEALLDRARKGEALAITDHRVLIGVIIPAAEAWAQHLICQNWPEVERNITEAEQAMAAGPRMTTVEDIADAPLPDRTGPHRPRPRKKTAVPLEAAIVGGGIAQTPRSKEVIRRLYAAWNLADEEPDDPSFVQAIRPVRIGDLSAALIRQAGLDRQALAVTHGRELVGILVPVTQDLVQFLIEQNMDRVLSSIEKAEDRLEAGDKMVTLDDEAGAADNELLGGASASERRHTRSDLDHIDTAFLHWALPFS